ncbi:uncharacterized protein AB9X84_004352 isoform 3-T3 [Acanthopagrus schlegelii]
MMSGQKSCYELAIELQGDADSVPSEEEQMLVKSGAEGGRAASWSGGAEGGRAASWPGGAEGGRAASWPGGAEGGRAASWPGGAEGGRAASWSGGAEGGRAASCEEQQEDLCQYTTDTLTYIETVKGFCEGFYTWMDAREEELFQMGGIKGRDVKADLSFSHVIQLVGRALWNVEVLSDQLEKYIKTTWKICVKLEKSLYVQIPTTETVVNLHVSEEGVQEWLCDIKLLNEIRMGEHFRTVFLFKYKSCSDFINEFNSCEPRMLESLKHLDDAADNLNYLNQVAKTFGVLGSLVGIGGGVLSIHGLVFSPARERVPLTKSGAYLGIFCTVIIVLAFIIELYWKYKQKKANELFQSFMEDMQGLQLCPKEKTNHQLAQIQESCVVEESMVFSKVRALVKSIDFVADIEGTSDIPYICQTSVKGHFNIIQHLFLVGANVLSLATDVSFIFGHCCSLIKCSETEASEIITARAELWRSQMDSWKKIHDSLCKGQRTSDEHQAVLDNLFNQGGQ